MTAVLINGKEISKELEQNLISQVQSFRGQYNRAPRFFLYQIGENHESLKHLRRKVKLAKIIGIDAHLSIEHSHVDPIAFIDRINSEAISNPSVDAVLVQLPLPKEFQAHQKSLLDSISYYKDVDGLCAENQRALSSAAKDKNKNVQIEKVIPCTPLGVLELVNRANDMLGRVINNSNVVVVGRSELVGKPTAELFQLHGGNVRICHSGTSRSELISICQNADILISACGVPGLLTDEMVSESAIVIDVGLTWVEERGLLGDVDFESVSKKCAAITPVPGGVGPMTMIMLMANVVHCARLHEEIKIAGCA